MDKNQKSQLIKMLALADEQNADYVVDILLNSLGQQLQVVEEQGAIPAPEILAAVVPAWKDYHDAILEHHIEQNDKISFIKYFRETVNLMVGYHICGLKEAKEIADQRFAEYQE